MDDEDFPYFEIPVNTAVDLIYSKNVCYEFGKMYFELKKSRYNPENFNSIYKNCIDTAKLTYDTNGDLPRLYLDKRILYIPNHFKEFVYEASGGMLYSSSLEHNICMIFPTSFMIMNTDIGSFIVIAYSWKEFLVCDPTASKAIAGPCEKIVEYIDSNYGELHIECLHMIK